MGSGYAPPISNFSSFTLNELIIQQTRSFVKYHFNRFSTKFYRPVGKSSASRNYIYLGKYRSKLKNCQTQAWAHVSADKREALVSLVTGSTTAALPFIVLRLRGLDPLGTAETWAPTELTG